MELGLRGEIGRPATTSPTDLVFLLLKTSNDYFGDAKGFLGKNCSNHE